MPAEAASIVPDGGRAQWPGSTLGADGSGKLAETVKRTPGAIGYTSSDYTLRDNLTAIALLSKRGELVKAELSAFKSAIVAGGLFKNSLELGDRSVAGTGFAPLPIATQARIVSLLSNFKHPMVDRSR